MRVIAGSARGLRLKAPEGLTTRPMADRVKESLFGTLHSMGYPQAGDRVLDLYAGTGSLGIEALSRGATWCDFVEQNPGVATLIAANLTFTRLVAQGAVHAVAVDAYLRAFAAGRGVSRTWTVEERARREPAVGRGRTSRPSPAEPWVAKSDKRPPADVKCDIIFMDPPYADPAIPAMLTRLAGTAFLSPDGVLVVGHARGVPMPATIGNLHQVRHKEFGGSAFSLYQYEQSGIRGPVSGDADADAGPGVGGQGSDDADEDGSPVASRQSSEDVDNSDAAVQWVRGFVSDDTDTDEA